MSASSEMSVVLPAALHARPAGALVRAAAGFTADVEIRYAGRAASARSVLAVLALGAIAGETVTVAVSGADAEAALAAVGEVLATAE